MLICGGLCKGHSHIMVARPGSELDFRRKVYLASNTEASMEVGIRTRAGPTLAAASLLFWLASNLQCKSKIKNSLGDQRLITVPELTKSVTLNPQNSQPTKVWLAAKDEPAKVVHF